LAVSTNQQDQKHLNPGNDRAIYRAAALQRNEARIAESNVLQCEKQIRNGLMNTFRIATYNVNSIRSRLHIIIPWLEENRPDVFCMQETKVSDAKFLFPNSQKQVIKSSSGRKTIQRCGGGIPSEAGTGFLRSE